MGSAGSLPGLRSLKTSITDTLRSRLTAVGSVSGSPERSGTATVETAVSLPLLVILVFGAIELANAAFLKQSLNMAAYEAAKVITRPGSNEDLARTRCDEIMSVRKAWTYTLTFSPTVIASTPRGTQVTVLLSAPASNLNYGPMQFMTGRTVTAQVVMVRL